MGAQILSFLLCGIVLIFLLARGERFRDALGFIVVLLVASIPIAIEIVRCWPMCWDSVCLVGGSGFGVGGAAPSSQRVVGAPAMLRSRSDCLWS